MVAVGADLCQYPIHYSDDFNSKRARDRLIKMSRNIYTSFIETNPCPRASEPHKPASYKLTVTSTQRSQDI